MFFNLVRVRFNKSVYRRNEDREPSEVCFKLKLNRRIPIKLKVKVRDISYTATGEWLSYIIFDTSCMVQTIDYVNNSYRNVFLYN